MLMNNDLAGVQKLLSSVWPDWKVTAQIGRGSYGFVYEIVRDDLASTYKCALKVLQMDSDTMLLSGEEDTDTLINPGRKSTGTSPRPAYRDEAAAAAQNMYSGHPDEAAAAAQNLYSSQTGLRPAEDLTAAGGQSRGPVESKAQKAVLEEFVLGVSTEIQLMLRLKGDPHVVSIEDYAILREPGTRTILIRMENLYCVSELAARYRGLHPQEVMRLGIDLCEALSHCEQYNILHRDIKPSNIFYSHNAGYKLGDFGISRTMESIYESMSMSGVGTLQFMAPEIYMGTKYSNTADIYSLGLTLYILLNENIPPFCGNPAGQNLAQLSSKIRHSANMRRLRGEALPPPAHADSRLAAVISKACDPLPENRYKTASEFELALRSSLYGTYESAGNAKDSRSGTGQRTRKLIPLVAAALTVTAAAALFTGWQVFSRGLPARQENTEPIQWTDSSLEAAVRNQCAFSGESPVTADQAEEITSLDLSGQSIYDISSLRYFTNLRTLNLADNHVMDLSPLSRLDKLADLNLENNAVTDISVLEKLTALDSLNLRDNSIKEISSLAGMNSLKTLNLAQTDVTDLSAAENLPSLSLLDVRYCPVRDASCIHRIRENSAAQIITAEQDMDIPDTALFLNGHSYFVFDPGCENWDEVLEFCHEKGGYPAVIESSEENEELYRYMLTLERTAVLFGYTDRVTEGKWEWADQKTSLFTDWGENDEGEKEPNAATKEEDFAQLDVHMLKGHWNDCAFGHDTAAFICEWDGFR